MVFLGIVATAMISATGSQTMATIGYGNVMTMESTAKSGKLATESFLTNPDNVNAILTDVIGKVDEEPYIYGNENTRVRLADNQFFRSRLISFEDAGNDYYNAKIRIGASRNQKGNKYQKEMVGFYEVCCLAASSTSQGQGYYGDNALELGGIMDADASFTVKGNATFWNNIKVNQGGLTFEQDNGKGDVYFHQKFTTNQKSNFNTNVFFNDEAHFSENGSPSVFNSNVAFNGKISAANKRTLDVVGNAWLNNGIDNNAILDGKNSGRISYITAKLPIKTSNCNIVNGWCNTHNMWEHEHINSVGDAFKNFPQNNNGANFSRASMLADLGNMKDFNERRNCSFTQADIAKETTDAGKKYFRVTDQPSINGVPLMLNSGSNRGINGVQLDKFIAAAKSNPAYKDYFYKDHLLIDFTGSGADFSGGPFTGKVIFVVHSGTITPNGNLYESQPGSSSLWYIGPNAILSGFGGQGDFHGLVHIDEKNNYDHQFRWGSNSTINGGVTMKGGNMRAWNSGNGSATIKHDPAITNQFTGFCEGEGGSNVGDGDVVLTPVKPNLELKPIGFYFY